ncbi:MAG: cytochrome c biogenesis heme-transporting ATPase CcmA [Gammaproteobacteria bacterium]|nr:cytochrome c biogenesis heme-transporting ATPase CcmA [Gammaproteobacteria bacterium]
MSLEGIGITCERDRRMLFENLDFQVSDGEILRIEGSNGSGKTTLLRIICGLFHSYDGDIKWQGKPISDDFAGYVDQLLYIGHAGGVKESLSPEENLSWLASLQDQEVSQKNIWEALAQVGLWGYEDVLCGSLSAGQKKRVNLARLFLIKAKLWLLDEPFSSIDVDGVKNLEVQIEQHLDGGGIVMLTSHQLLNINHAVRSLLLGY